jgi:hypothetical protein
LTEQLPIYVQVGQSTEKKNSFVDSEADDNGDFEENEGLPEGHTYTFLLHPFTVFVF